MWSCSCEGNEPAHHRGLTLIPARGSRSWLPPRPVRARGSDEQRCLSAIPPARTRSSRTPPGRTAPCHQVIGLLQLPRPGRQRLVICPSPLRHEPQGPDTRRWSASTALETLNSGPFGQLAEINCLAEDKWYDLFRSVKRSCSASVSGGIRVSVRMPGMTSPDGWGTRPVLCGRVAHSPGEMIMAGAGISPRKAIRRYMTPRVQ